MNQLNAYRFYELGAKLHELFSFGDQARVADLFAPLTETQTLLDSFIKGEVFIPDSSKADANKLLAKISGVFNRYFIDPSSKQIRSPAGEDRIDAYEMSTLRSHVEKFEQALAAELTRAPVYLAGSAASIRPMIWLKMRKPFSQDPLRAIIPSMAQKELKPLAAPWFLAWARRRRCICCAPSKLCCGFITKPLPEPPPPKGSATMRCI